MQHSSHSSFQPCCASSRIGKARPTAKWLAALITPNLDDIVTAAIDLVTFVVAALPVSDTDLERFIERFPILIPATAITR